MRRISTLTLLTVSLVVSTAFGHDKYVSGTGKYQVSFPGKPTTSMKDVETAAGKLTMHVAAIEVNKEFALLVIHGDYPDTVIKTKTARQLLENVRDGSKGSDGKIFEDKEITLGTEKTPGRAFLLDKGEHFGRARIFLHGARLYQVIVVGRTKDDVSTKEAEKFLESFEIVK